MLKFNPTKKWSNAGPGRILRTSAASLLVVMIMVLASGCGGAAPTPTSTPTQPPPAAFTATLALVALPTATLAPPTAVPTALPVPPTDLPAAPGAGTPSVISPTTADVPYAALSSAETLDLYLPTSGAGPFPVVVNIHPGGFLSGQKAMIPGNTARALVAAGYAFVSINYRLSDEALFPAAVFDAKAAVRFLRANAAKYNLNPDKIAAFGQSAGGNLAAILGTSAGVAELEGTELGNESFSSKVQAVIDWYGPNDFTLLDAQAKAQDCGASDQAHNTAASPESKYLGAALPTVPDLAKKANPITYISPKTPPFLIQKGDQDCTIAIENTKMLADALSAAHLDVHYDLLKNVGHGDQLGTTTPVFESDTNIKAMIDFLNTKLNMTSQAQPGPASSTSAAGSAAPTPPVELTATLAAPVPTLSSVIPTVLPVPFIVPTVLAVPVGSTAAASPTPTPAAPAAPQ